MLRIDSLSVSLSSNVTSQPFPKALTLSKFRVSVYMYVCMTNKDSINLKKAGFIQYSHSVTFFLWYTPSTTCSWVRIPSSMSWKENKYHKEQLHLNMVGVQILCGELLSLFSTDALISHYNPGLLWDPLASLHHCVVWTEYLCPTPKINMLKP